MASTQPARGMRDFLPREVRKRDYVIGIIKQVYESYGFEPLETPAVENIDTLMGKYGEEGNQLIFKILKRGEKLGQETRDGSKEIKESELADLALRYDLTVPLARVIVNNRDKLPKFFKRYQIQPVWRADRPARGRFREFYQCDVDAIGSKSMLVEAEIICAASEILERLGFEDFKIRVNHRAFLTAFLNSYELPSRMHTSVLTALDKLDKTKPQVVVNELVERGMMDQNAADLLDSLKNLQELASHSLDNGLGLDTFFDMLQTAYGIRDEGRMAIEDLRAIWTYVSGVQAGRHFSIDLSLARGLSYYTGTIMEINVPDLAGSLGGGGRYDALIGMFGKEQIPACGFSLGLERILVVMDERGMFPPEIAESPPADVLVTIWSDETAAESLKLAQELRSAGLRVTLYPEPDKLGKQIKYADSIRVSFLCVLGESEIADGTVTIKNMKSGDQQTVTRADAAGLIA